MSTLEHSVWIRARPEAVWRIYADPARIPDWQTGSPRIEKMSGSADAPGSTYVSRRGPAVARTTVIAAQAPHQLVTRTEAYIGLVFDVDSRLVADGDGTSVSLRVETQWPRGLGLIGKIVERAILSPREAAKELSNLKEVVEREADG